MVESVIQFLSLISVGWYGIRITCTRVTTINTGKGHEFLVGR